MRVLVLLFLALLAPGVLPPADVTWPPPPVQDQHGAPDCVAAALVEWLESTPGSLPARRAPTLPALYADARARGGQTDVQVGAFLWAGWAALGADGLIVPGSARYTSDLPTALAWLAAGPWVVEVPWYGSMWSSPGAGLLRVVPDGSRTRHVVLCDGSEAGGTIVDCLQSWGPGWGQAGQFRLRAADLVALLAHGWVSTATKTRPPGWAPRIWPY